MLANRWRVAFAGGAPVDLVANADDPLVVWAAGQAERVHWIGAGLGWRNDAVGCPSCGEQVTFADAFGAGLVVRVRVRPPGARGLAGGGG